MLKMSTIMILSYAFLCGVAAFPATGDEISSPMELIGRLQDVNPEIRLEAVRALQKKGIQAKVVVPALIEVLEDKEPLIRIEAARALGAIGPDAKAAVPALVKRFDDKEGVRFERAVWFAAAVALGKIGPASVPALIAILEKKDWARFIAVSQALYGIGPDAKQAVPYLLSALKNQSDDEIIRDASIYALGGIGAVTEDVVPALIAHIPHANFHTQYFTCRALGEIGPKARAATPDLIEVIATGVTSVRRHAARALGRIGADDEKVSPLLIKLLGDESYPVRVEAALALGNLGPPAKSALPELVRAMQDKKLSIKVEAASSIWVITGDAARILPVLIDELENVNNSVQAARLLGDIGVAAKSAIPALQKATKSEDEETSEAAVDALERIQVDSGLPVQRNPQSP